MFGRVVEPGEPIHSALSTFLVTSYNMVQVSAEQPWVNSRFTLDTSDIEIRSSDGFVFQLHRILLETGTGAFPGSDIETGGEIIDLSEPADVLGILFAFLYPKKQSDLLEHSFALVIAVAEAAEKYEVFSAMTLCSLRLMKFLPLHAPDILVHAVKHDYSSLIYAAVPCFARSPFINVVEKLPPSLIIPWARYQDAWKGTFKEAFETIYKMEDPTGYRDNLQCHVAVYPPDLEAIESLELLQASVHHPRATAHRFRCCGDTDSKKVGVDCKHVAMISAFLRIRIEQIPAFDKFLQAH
ncbi:hypothetical protein CVT26_008827 [Gymnopilus dilepis]|uniref:BTB domain-containing protein n=1 Tax=Gymnopilus dilepis TaxID=231916 RepID=A0A409WP75_9AGAR|nr:hypothetical protein CVT26_008827 [Gymnopilus dilepis]